MKTQSVTNIRLVEDKERLLLNFAFSLWFEKELEKVNSGSNAKKKKRYAKLDPFKMVVEPPVVLKGDYFYVCAADRPGGTLLVDKKVPYLTLETFLEKSKVSDKINQDGSFNQTLADAIKNKTVNLKLIREIIASPDNLSTDPIYYLTKLYDESDSEGEGGDDSGESSGSEEETETQQPDTRATEETDAENGEGSETDDGTSDDTQKEDDSDGEYFIIFDSKTGEPDFDALVSWIFRDYTFEEIDFEIVEEGDADYPSEAPTADNPASFYTGKVTLKDTVLKEKSIEMHFIDLYLLSKTITDTIPVDPEDAKIVEVVPEKPTPIEPDADEKVVGEGTVITTSAKIEDDDLVLESVMDDLGNDLSKNSELVIKENDRTKITTAIKVKNFNYAYSFPYPTGERRRLDATFKLKGDTSEGQAVVIPVDYQLDDESIVPSIKSIDTSNGINNAVIEMTFSNASGALINRVVPQYLDKDYKMFVEGSGVVFLGDSTELGDGVDGKGGLPDTLKFSADLGSYGSVNFKFADPALKDITYNVADASAKFTINLVKIDYTDDKLTLDYNLLQNGTVYETDEKAYTSVGIPNLTINNDTYKPQTTWTKTGFTNVYTIGKGVNATDVVARGQLVVAANSVVVGFMDTITITAPEDIPETTATISTLVINGGYIDPSADKITTDVGQGSLILISDANQVKASGIKLTRFTDALGTDITDKVEAVFTQLDDDATQFTVNMTINDYQWPMSFDNQGSNGEFECEFKLLGNANSAKSAKGSYKLSYGYEGITPRPINAQLSNNSLNKAKLYVSFTDKYYNTFETGLEQHIAINPPLFGSSDVVYIGYDITYGEDDDNHFGAYIPVNFGKFGDLTLSFADTQFKAVPFSVADPKANYSLVAYNEGFVDSGDYAVRFRLNKDNKPYSLQDGKIISDSIKVNIDSQAAKVTGIGWTPDDDAGAVLTVYATLPEGANKSSFTAELTGQFYVGINNVGINIEYTVDHAEV